MPKCAILSGRSIFCLNECRTDIRQGQSFHDLCQQATRTGPYDKDQALMRTSGKASINMEVDLRLGQRFDVLVAHHHKQTEQAASQTLGL